MTPHRAPDLEAKSSCVETTGSVAIVCCPGVIASEVKYVANLRPRVTDALAKWIEIEPDDYAPFPRVKRLEEKRKET